MEQLVARRAHNPKVVRSSRAPATRKGCQFWQPFFYEPLNLHVKMDEFVVYVLFSEKYNKIYVGYTSALIDRFMSHNALAKSGYTVKFRPWIVVHTEFFSQKKDAMIREKQLKSSQGRAFIRTQILSYI